MLGDRLFDRVRSKEMIILERMSKEHAEEHQTNWDRHLQTAYTAYYTL